MHIQAGAHLARTKAPLFTVAHSFRTSTATESKIIFAKLSTRETPACKDKISQVTVMVTPGTKSGDSDGDTRDKVR